MEIELKELNIGDKLWLTLDDRKSPSPKITTKPCVVTRIGSVYFYVKTDILSPTEIKFCIDGWAPATYDSDYYYCVYPSELVYLNYIHDKKVKAIAERNERFEQIKNLFKTKSAEDFSCEQICMIYCTLYFELNK